MRSIELFAGCGGLALGLSRAGFKHELVVERDICAFDTLRLNKARRISHVVDWKLSNKDVRDLDYGWASGQIDLVSGGPPCQPFSIGGKHLGPEDDRNMWPEAVRAVREIMPRSFLFENVKGLLRAAFSDYLDYVLLQLRFPELEPKDDEDWMAHRGRLQAFQKLNRGCETYRVVIRSIDAADYGAAQKRHRVIVVGVRSDVATDWEFPAPTHSVAALAWSKNVTGTYWQRHEVAMPDRSGLSREEQAALNRLHRPSRNGTAPLEKPWVTVRDKLVGLSEASVSGADWNHNQHPGARSYVGHSGSVIDQPAKALKAGMHGVPGGENSLAVAGGGVRYFTVREMARLQGLPDDFLVTGKWNQVTRQLGNAVPAEVGQVLGEWIAKVISEGARKTDRLSHGPVSPPIQLGLFASSDTEIEDLPEKGVFARQIGHARLKQETA